MTERRAIAPHLLCLALLLATTACSKGQSQNQDDGQHAKPTSAHAAKDVKPGSHEDWCEEHAVPESQCSRCNPELVPAFKATGDWCAEHGLPESQCLKCNPNLKIVRPPKGS